MDKKHKDEKYYPVALRLNRSFNVVVGGGQVAQRKVLGLLQAGAMVKVVSPDLTFKLRHLAEIGRIKWVARKVRQEDLEEGLVIAATNQAKINNRISLWAKKKGVLINVVDKPALSSFISPAVFKQNKAVIAVNSNGRDPEFSRDLKNFLKEHWYEFLSYRRRLPKRAS